MTSVRRLEIRVDQTGSASKGIAGITGSVGKIASIGLTAGIAAATGVAALTVGVVKLGSKLSGLGADAEEMKAKFNVVFGDSAPEAAAELDEFGDAVGRNKFALMEMASTVQDTFVPLGFARDKAKDMSVDMTKLAVDVGSFNNTLAPDVMRDFQSAIVGNHETVRKYGIIMTQATLDQELLRMGVEGGVKAATEQEKVQARLNIIYDGTTDAQGDAAATAGSWTNQMLAMKEAVAEGATEMGLMLNESLLPLLSEFVPWIKEIMPKAVEVFGKFAGDLKESIGPAMSIIKDAITDISEAFGVNTEEVSTADVVLLAFEKLLGVVTTTVKLVAIGFWATARAVDGVKKAWDKTGEFVRSGLDGWKLAFDSVKRGVDKVKEAWNKMKTAASDAVNSIPDWLRPGSPTPFEMGLKGIADAAKEIKLDTGLRGAGTPALAAGAGVGGVQIHLTYAPLISTADAIDIETKVVPLLISALRKAGVDVG